MKKWTIWYHLKHTSTVHERKRDRDTNKLKEGEWEIKGKRCLPLSPDVNDHSFILKSFWVPDDVRASTCGLYVG